ncbi:MAG: hypothetical protein EU532_09710 [Promethearchaeota archaeon]|nr:MAG: hypothetical protein EU532_09710 [Candidatus Lokiarchaeota archaeon]
MENNLEEIKVVFAGLDNSGKTSIVLNLIGEVDLFNFTSLNPTKGSDISNITDDRTNYIIWDLGGQKQYREEYLLKFMEYFKGAKKLIYVIDIQNIDNYDVALEYLRNIIEQLKKNKKELDIDIFLHKFDPHLSKIRPHVTEEKITNLIDEIKQLFINEDYVYEIFKTSIYTTFDKRIIF